MNEKGITLQPRKSNRFPSVPVTDADFALLADSLTNAQDLLRSLENGVNSLGLCLNEMKRQGISLYCSNKSNSK